VVSPSPTSDHQIIVKQILVALALYAQHRDLGEVIPGPVDVVLGPDVVYVPDICYVAKQRLDILKPTHIAGPPDLCVEVISESTRTHDTVVKFQHYAHYGAREYWLVDAREAEISTWKSESGEFSLIGRARLEQLVASAVFSDLRLNAALIFTRFQG
jgi:Uma2 family endonuclease